MTDTTVLIVDDHAVVRTGLRMLIEPNPDLRVIGEAASIREAIDLASAARPTVITLDLSMPGSSGLAAIETIRHAAPVSKILVVTMHDDPAFARAALAMGAAGFVSKSAADTEIVAAIRAVSRGRISVDAAATPPSPGVQTSPLESLSDREREVLRDVARGYTSQQIADRAGLSVKTVESYRSRVMKKLNLKDRADLVRLAIDAGLV